MLVLLISVALVKIINVLVLLIFVALVKVMHVPVLLLWYDIKVVKCLGLCCIVKDNDDNYSFASLYFGNYIV